MNLDRNSDNVVYYFNIKIYTPKYQLIQNVSFQKEKPRNSNADTNMILNMFNQIQR